MYMHIKADFENFMFCQDDHFFCSHVLQYIDVVWRKYMLITFEIKGFVL